VVFREFGGTSKYEGVQMEKEPKKLVFELRNNEHDSNELAKSDEQVEHLTPVVRRSKRVRKPTERYSPPYFRFAFDLYAIEEERKSIREEVDST
jgi:hypothetical protein